VETGGSVVGRSGMWKVNERRAKRGYESKHDDRTQKTKSVFYDLHDRAELANERSQRCLGFANHGCRLGNRRSENRQSSASTHKRIPFLSLFISPVATGFNSLFQCTSTILTCGLIHFPFTNGSNLYRTLCRLSGTS